MAKNMSFLEQEQLRIAREQLAQQMAAQQPSGPMTPQQKNQQAKNNAYMDALKAYIGTATYPASGQDPLVGDVFAYAAKGEAERNQLANSLMTGAGVKPKRGDVQNWDYGAARKAVVANEGYMRALRDIGMYDTRENATNAQMVSMVSGNYLNDMLTAINEDLNASMTADRKSSDWMRWYDMLVRMNEMDETNEQAYWAYADYLLGDQAEPWDYDRYNRTWGAMGDADYQQEMDRLRTQFEGLDLPALATKNGEYKSMTSAYQEQLATVQREMERRAELAALEQLAKSNPNFETLNAYTGGLQTPEYYANYDSKKALRNDAATAAERNRSVEWLRSVTSDPYHFINADISAEAEQSAAKRYDEFSRMQARGYRFMTADEISVYNVLYNTEPEKAREYLDTLQTELYRRAAEVEKMGQQVYATNGAWAVPSWLASVGAGVENIFMAPIQFASAAMGTDDPNAPEFYFNRAQQNIRNAQEEVLGELDAPEIMGKNLYQWGYGGISSAADNAARLMFGPRGSLAAAGLQSASSSLYENAGREDMSGAAKITQALLTGGLEVGTEKIGLDALFDMGQESALKYLVKAIGSELGEESVNYFGEYGVELAVAWLFGHEAEIRSAEELARGYGETVLNTLISSGVMSGPGAVMTGSNTRNQGIATRTQGNVDALMNIGMSMPETSKTGAIARELDAKKKKGKTYSNYDLGRLTMAIEEETSAELAEAPNKVMDEAIEERLVELGETKENAKALAPVVRQTSRGQKATIKQRAAMKWNDNAEQVVKELTRETAAEDADRAGNAWVGELKGKTFGATAEGGAKLMTVYEATGKVKKQESKEQTATEKAVDKAVERAATKVRVTKSDKVKPTAVAVTVNDGTGETAGNVTRFVEQDGEAKLEVQTEGGNMAVNLDQLGSAEGSGVAAIAAWVEESNEGAEGTHQMSAQEASTMLQVYQTEGGDAGTFIRGFEDAYLAGYSGVESAASGISKQAAQIAWEQGRAEAQADEKTRVERASRARTSSEGTVGWLGTASSNAQVQGRGDANALSEAMEGMTESQRTTAEVVQAFAETFKTNVVLFESDADNIGSIQNGSFNSDTNTIYIDINAGAFTKADVQTMRKNGTLGYAMMKTLGHEVTHYLEANSANAYAAYKAAVKQELKAQGEDWATLVRSKIREAHLDGRKMTYAGAEAEVVADASEYMLQNSKFVSGLESGTKGTVKRIIQNFMQKLNEVFSNLTGGRRESKALRKQINGVYQYTGNLQQLWDAAMDEAMGRTDIQGNQSVEATEMVDDTVMEAEAEEASDAAVEDSDTEEDAAPEEVAAEEVYDEPAGMSEERTMQDVIVNPTAQEIQQETKATAKRADPELIEGLKERFGLNVQVAGNRTQLLAAYNKADDTILIGKNASTGEVLYKALAMEMFRSVEGTKYAADLRNALWHAAYQGDFAAYAADTRAVADMLNRKFDNYGNRKLNAESTLVQREMNARMAAQVLGNADSLNSLLETERPTLLRKIRNALRNFVNKLRGIKSPAMTPLMRAEQMMTEALDERARTKGKRAKIPANFGMQSRQDITAAVTMMGEEVALGMDETAGDVQYSSRADEIQETMAEAIDTQTESATPQYSIRTWAGSDYVTQRDEAAKRLAKSLHVSVAKAKKWIDDVNSVSAYVLNNKARLDYIPTAVEGVSAFKSNPEYGGSIDMSTICAKRRLATGTLDAIQRELGDIALTKDDFLHIREMMKERGHEVACGLCFVESSRKNLSKYNKQFMDQYNSTHPGSELTMGDLNTVDGLERLRLRNQEAYAEYEKFMNKLAQRKPKLFEKRTEYNHEILSKFKSDTTVGNKNLHGGLRLQSFSDFEIVHLIDMMQVITDMASVGLAGQAYTKVPDFAWALGDTGLKINLSLIAKGVDDNGNLIFDDVEGMNHNEAKRIRDRYSENVGTIVVTFTDEQLMAAMKSDFVDFIIPFHRSQWQKSDYKTLGLPEGTKDYTMHQNEKQGRKRVKENYAPNEYWNFKLTGKQNAENYLKKCAKDGRTPKFAKFLVNNGDGSYSLQPDGSTDGYWKLLIDFKMYDNLGKGSKQMPVKPNFNMDEAMRMMEEYKGEHDSFPVAQDVVDDFVQEFRGNRGGVKNAGGKYGVNNVQLSTRTPEDTLSIREYLSEMKPTARMNETEKILLKRYQEQLKILREKEQLVAEQDEIIRKAPVPSDELTMAKNRRNIYRAQANRAARALAEAERNDGFARLMATSQEVVNRYVLGSAGNVADAADALDAEVASLTRQLKAVEADVTRTASAQKTAFARGLYDQQTLNRAAQKLKDTYGSRMAAKTIADRLALVYGEIYANDGAEGAKRFAEAAKDLAYDILAGHKYRYKSEILPMLQEKIGTISLTETDLQEIKNAGMTVSEYKRAIGPWVKVAEGASDLSSFASNAAYYGDGALAAILGDDSEGNLAMNLYNTIQQEKAQEQEIGVEGMSEGQMVTAVMADIAGSDMPLSTNSKTVDYLRSELKKFAGESTEAAKSIEQAIMNAKKATGKASDVWRQAVKEVDNAKAAVEYYRKLEEQRRLTELKELKQTITEELKGENAKKLQAKIREQREEYRTREQKAREYRKTRDAVDKLRRKIGRDVKRLNNLRVRETDQKHVPQEMQHVADAVMRTFTDSALSRLAFSAEKTASLQRTYQILAELESDFAYYWDDEIKADMDNLVSLSEAYNAIRNREAGAPSYLSLEGVELEMEILQGVDNIVSNVLHMIDTANRNFLAGRQETFESYANKTGEKLSNRKDAKVLKGAAGKIQTMIDETLRTGNVTPVYFFEHLQNDELRQVFDQIRKGQSKYAKIVAEGKAFVDETKSKYNYGAWAADGKLKMKTGQGHEIELTREEAAEIYAVYKREQANKLYRTEHLLEGGFQYRNIAEKGAGAYQATDKPHQLDAADMAKISEWLTDEQKAYADELVGYLSTTMADYGNAASMDMYGYKKFTESYYIPFKTVADQRFQRGDEGPQGENAGTGRVKNAGFTKKLQNKANQPLVIGGITDTVADHIHKMAAYSAMVQPIEDMKRLLNHKVMEEDGTVNTIRALIGQKYGKATENYLTQLLKDLNGATQSDNRASDLTNRLISAFKRGAVLASASVVLQQPTAMARAMAYISPKYFAQNPFYRPSKGTWEEMMKYAGTAVIKDMGKFDVGMGLTATQYISDEKLGVFETYRRLKADSKTKAGKAAYDRFMERLTAAPGIADQWTWGIIWKAVKAEQTALHPDMDVNSEAFLQMCGERFDDVIDHTQVYDSVITRSNLMRSSNQLHKMATSFMSEPVLSLNMLYDALVGDHSKGKRGAIIGSVVASQVLAGAMAALAQAWNDDDDKRNWLEKYADRAVSNIFDNLNPLGMMPYVSDVISMFQGYDVERPDMTVIADLMDYTKTFMKAFEDGGAPSWKQIENFAGTWANLLGLPLKNISREVRRLRNAVMSTDWSEPNMTNVGFVAAENVSIFGVYNPWGGEKKDYYNRMITAMQKGNDDLVEDYRTYLTDSKMVEPDKLTTGLRDAYKERYQVGGIEKDEAVRFLVENGLAKDQKSAFEYVDRWEEGGENHSAYKSIRENIWRSDFAAVTEGIRELEANGWTPQQIYNALHEDVDEQYMLGSMTQAQYKAWYNSHGVAAGKPQRDDNDWYWEFKRLDWGKAHGGSDEGYNAYEDLYKAVETGGAGLSQVIRDYQTHGKSREDLNGKLNSYYKPKLIEAKRNGRGFADLQAKVLTAYQLLGYDRQQKLKTIQKWLEEAQ